MIEVFARRTHRELVGAFLKELRDNGLGAREGYSPLFDPAQVDRKAKGVFHDGTNPLIPWTYEKLGIPCELIPGIQAETAHSELDEHHLQKVDGGFQLADRSGNPVGLVEGNEADAWGQRPATGEGDGMQETAGDGGGETLQEIRPGEELVERTVEGGVEGQASPSAEGGGEHVDDAAGATE